MNASAFRFEPIAEHHLPMLREWLLRPHVAQWWGEAESLSALRRDYVHLAREPNATSAYIVHFRGEPIGFIQTYVVMACGGGWWEDETDPGARGIDQFLCASGMLGQGLGRRMIRAFVAALFRDPAVSSVQADPAQENVRAIRCYTAAGFQATGPVTTPDGPALLMRCTRQSLALAASTDKA